MKIALLTGTYSAFSGIDRVVEQQAKQLLRAGHQVKILAFAADLKPPRGAELIILSAPTGATALRVFRLIYPFLIWRWKKDLRFLADRDQVHVHQYPLTILGWKAKQSFGARYIFHDYGIPPVWSFPSLRDQLYMRLFHILSTKTILPADQAISISHYLRRVLKKNTGLSSTVAYPTIDRHRFQPSVSGQMIRQRYGLNNDSILLFVGRLVPYKGVHFLLEILRLIQKTVPKAKLLVVGNPTFPAYFRRLQNQAPPGVIFAGYVADQDLPAYYGACTTYVTASSWEGYDLPIVEAQAVGKPVVAFRIGSHPEVIDQRGQLVEEGDIHAFAQAVIDRLSLAK